MKLLAEESKTKKKSIEKLNLKQKWEQQVIK